MTLWARAAARAGLPVRRSEGFNPRPRIVLPLPRPVGVASDAECAVFELTALLPPEELAARLSAQMPGGITVRHARMLAPNERCLPIAARYRVAKPGVDWTSVADAAKRLSAAESIPYERFVHKESRHTHIDLRPFLDSVEVNEDHARFTLRVTPQGSIKPAEFCDVLGIGGQHVNHHIRRLEILWQ